MLHVGLDLSRKRIDVCLISIRGSWSSGSRRSRIVTVCMALARRVAVYGEPVRGVVESMNGARFVHDELVGARVGGAGRRRAEGQGAGAVGVQDGQVGMDRGSPRSDEMLGLTRRARSPCR